MSTAIKTGSTVRAYELPSEFGIDSLQLRDRTAEPLKANQVRIRVKAISLNYRDLLVVKGLYSRNLKTPLVPISDGAGEVIEVGELVTRVKVGDRVCGIFMQGWVDGPATAEAAQTALGGAIDGMLADHVVLNQDGVVKFPEHLSFEEAATLPCAGVTAWNALVSSGGLKAGETILTLGTGGVSIFALQFAKMSGARIIITSSSDDKLERAKKIGAHDIINYKKNEEWEKQAIEYTHGVGVDQVIELGGPGTLSKSFKAARVGGRVSLIGVLAGGEGAVNPMPVLMKSICLQGIFVGSRRMFEDMNAAIELHKIRPIIDKTFNFDQVKQALKYMESGQHFGKIVVKI